MKISRKKILFLWVIFSSLCGFSQKENIFQQKVNDSTVLTVKQITDKKSGLPLYYSCFAELPVCATGECRIVRITLFWDSFGNYFKYLVPKNFPLTKDKHKPFSEKEYRKLHLILNDTSLRYGEFNLRAEDTERNAQEIYRVDAITGETPKPFIDERRIIGAIKTTWYLWRVVNGDIRQNIRKRTEELLKNNDLELMPKLFELSYRMEKDPKEAERILKEDFKQKSLDEKILTANCLLRIGRKTDIAKRIIKITSFINK